MTPQPREQDRANGTPPHARRRSGRGHGRRTDAARGLPEAPPGDEQHHRPVLERMSSVATRWAGSGPAFAVAAGLIVAWLVSGPLFKWSDTWQLVINTTTTIVTFLMVFLIQRAQNRDALAVSLKLNELLAATEGASNRLLEADRFSEKELELLGAHFEQLVRLAREDGSLTASHSVEEAGARHERKRRRRPH
jgi:low affinity Fe/Cu permease